LIGTFANGVVIGRKANGESRFKHHGKVRSRFDGFQVDMLGHASILAELIWSKSYQILVI
jgi:hypothetical protein